MQARSRYIRKGLPATISRYSIPSCLIPYHLILSTHKFWGDHAPGQPLLETEMTCVNVSAMVSYAFKAKGSSGKKTPESHYRAAWTSRSNDCTFPAPTTSNLNIPAKTAPIGGELNRTIFHHIATYAAVSCPSSRTRRRLAIQMKAILHCIRRSQMVCRSPFWRNLNAEIPVLRINGATEACSLGIGVIHIGSIQDKRRVISINTVYRITTGGPPSTQVPDDRAFGKINRNLKCRPQRSTCVHRT